MLVKILCAFGILFILLLWIVIGGMLKKYSNEGAKKKFIKDIKNIRKL